MSLSIYTFVAYYILKGKLAQVVSGWRFGVQILLAVSKWEVTVARWQGHCSASDFRWSALTMRYIGKNRQFIAKSHIYREKSAISRDKSRNIAGPIFLHEISRRNPSIHDISAAIYRRNISTFSSLNTIQHGCKSLSDTHIMLGNQEFIRGVKEFKISLLIQEIWLFDSSVELDGCQISEGCTVTDHGIVCVLLGLISWHS